MCTSTTVQPNAEPPKTGIAVPQFWRIIKIANADLLAPPADLDSLTPHMRRDIGLDSRAAKQWSDATAHIDRDPRRP
jgi:hypothetical protein